MRRAWLLSLSLTLAACSQRTEPPGAASTAASSTLPQEIEIAGQAAEEASSSPPVDALEPGSQLDALPFEPTGLKLASTAWRTWVYTDVTEKRTRYGYLRAGTITDARPPAIVNAGCPGGWYRINPRGFVCIGKGASLSLDEPVVMASDVRPVRGQGFPYLYAMASDSPPFRYFRLPSAEEMRTVEGEGVAGRALAWRQGLAAKGVSELLGEPGAPPDLVANAKVMPRPYGVIQRLHLSVHSGRAAADSGFALLRTFTHEGRVFGLTTELDLIALDRTRLIKPSSFHGVSLEPGEELPVVFVESYSLQKYEPVDGGTPKATGSWQRREGVKLTGKTVGGQFWETRDGLLMPLGSGRLIKPRESFPSFATGTRKWIDLSIEQQALVAYEGTRPVYVTLVSTGRGGLGDPEKTHATVRGTFMIVTKHVTATMDGEDDVSDSYNLLDVPFVQYFHNGYALHGTYWHDNFGQVRSHGCVNLSPIDSAWLFEWTDPSVPADWHGVINKDRGTVVVVRP